MDRPVVITHHELVLEIKQTGRKNPVTPLTRISIFDIFSKLQNKGYETKDRRFKDNRFCGLLPIISVSASKNRVDLMLCLSDKDADNQIVRDFDNVQNIRPLTRKDTEGVDSIAHVVISLDKTTPTVSKFAIERKTGLTPRFFIDTLNYFLKDLIAAYPDEFKGNHPTDKDSKGNPKKLPLKLKFEYESVLSDEIVNAFEKGRVKDVLFHEKLPQSKPFDPYGNFVPNKRTVHLDVQGKLINQNSRTTKEKLSDLKVGFKGVIKGNKSLKGTTFTIKFQSESGQNQTAYYDSTYDELSLAKKTYLPESVKEPIKKPLTLNQELCNKMFLQIK